MADQSVRGQFVWHELKTPDANAAHAFYGKAIGWKSQPWEEDSSYVMFAAKPDPSVRPRSRATNKLARLRTGFRTSAPAISKRP